MSKPVPGIVERLRKPDFWQAFTHGDGALSDEASVAPYEAANHIERLEAVLASYQRFAGETAGKCLGLAMSTDHPAPDEVLMGIFEASQKLAKEAREALSLIKEGKSHGEG